MADPTNGGTTQVPIRGAIKVAIATSSDTLVAGQDFSIFVTIRNPFEVPLVLHSIATYLPTELLDADKHLRDLQALDIEEQIVRLEDARRSLGQPPTGFLPHRSRALAWLPKPLLNLAPITLRTPGYQLALSAAGSLGPTIARDLTSEAQFPVKMPFHGDVTHSIKNRQHKELDEEGTRIFVRSINEEMQEYRDALTALDNIATPAKTLQPGNSTTRTFTIRSRKAIWFRPAAYRLQIEVEYSIGGIRNIDTIEHPIQIKASLTSMVLGAFIGGLGGWFTGHGSVGAPGASSILSLTVSLMMAAMAVVLFARKKEVQPIITVEDFWGGVALGFLVAYTGPTVLASLAGGAK
jgi:hypothetical protein